MSRMSALTSVTAVCCGVAGGVLFGFSAFIMRALDALAPADAVRAMQSINRFAVTPAFMTLLFGTALLALALVVVSFTGDDAPQPLVLVACALYLVGVVGVTVAGNVPLNDTLALVDPSAGDVAARWSAFSDPWTTLNHVRTAAAVLAAAALTAT